MRVLVTRPEPAASRTAERVRALGIEPVLLPVSRTKLEPEAIAPALSRPWSGVAVTSANAIRALSAANGAVEALAHLPVFAVGERTGKAAVSAGFSGVRTGSGRGRDLVAKVVGEISGRAGLAPLLYCAGEPRSGAFERGLAAAGIPYETVVCYRMEGTHHSPEELARISRAGAIDVVLLYSRESATRFFSLLSGSRLEVRAILCLSAHVASAVPDEFRPVVTIAAEPNEDALLEKLATVQT